MMWFATNFQVLETCSVCRLFLFIIFTKKYMAFQWRLPLEGKRFSTLNYPKARYLAIHGVIKGTSCFLVF